MVQELISNDPRPLIFVPYRQEGWESMSIMLESSLDPTAAVRAAVQALDAELPLREVSTLSAALEHQTWFLRVFGNYFSEPESTSLSGSTSTLGNKGVDLGTRLYF